MPREVVKERVEDLPFFHEMTPAEIRKLRELMEELYALRQERKVITLKIKEVVRDKDKYANRARYRIIYRTKKSTRGNSNDEEICHARQSCDAHRDR